MSVSCSGVVETPRARRVAYIGGGGVGAFGLLYLRKGVGYVILYLLESHACSG
ncbi:uncharacterized protein BP01DRAFT_187978 [Aspergillus saccharolyticus JOP 1030-1]|uniref:Uncharacterized protein n=1 Tax=Aspergillus saccharolyticus JOP 1030-1 TaxID=1450539 RepID=A0A318ZC70_9EURO|nr:hypothetical protein BP01DRAFT_187978 [Aspergillus saccharolyticus JOP 1030-1]PYH41080.1 hypothetical protein BP01DRAFT_187978 [Aspergillus saccharolyticus JOP 1030-1]